MLRSITTPTALEPDDLERMYYSNKGSIYGVINDRRKNMSLNGFQQVSFCRPNRQIERTIKRIQFVIVAMYAGGRARAAITDRTEIRLPLYRTIVERPGFRHMFIETGHIGWNIVTSNVSGYNRLRVKGI